MDDKEYINAISLKIKNSLEAKGFELEAISVEWKNGGVGRDIKVTCHKRSIRVDETYTVQDMDTIATDVAIHACEIEKRGI